MKKIIVVVSLSLASGVCIDAKIGIEPQRELKKVHCQAYLQKMNVAEVTKNHNSIPAPEVTTVNVTKNSIPERILPAIEKVVEKPTQMKSERTVLVSNTITKDMITYKKHWTGNYTPSTFVVKINDKELKQEEIMPVQVIDDIVQLSFTYEFKVFGKVQRAGGRVVTYKIPKNVEKLLPTFSWDFPSNIILDKGCEVVSCRDLT